MNESVSSVTVKALQSDNSDAKTVNLQVINATIITDPEIPLQYLFMTWQKKIPSSSWPMLV